MQDVIFEDSPVSFNKQIFIMYFTIRAVRVDNVRKDDDRVFSLKIRRLEFPVFIFMIYVISIASIVGLHFSKLVFMIAFSFEWVLHLFRVSLVWRKWRRRVSNDTAKSNLATRASLYTASRKSDGSQKSRKIPARRLTIPSK